MNTTLLGLADVLDESEFFDRERTDRQFVEVAILLYDCGVSLHKAERVLGWIASSTLMSWFRGEFRSSASDSRKWVSSQSSTCMVVLLDETAVTQHGEEFTVFVVADTETRHLLHASVALSRNTLTTRWFLSEFAKLYGRAPPTVMKTGL